MHTISIEEINLNGTIITTDNGGFIVDGQSLSTDRVVIDEHFFIKGYVPISFFSSLPMSGLKLTEVLFGSKFVATGWMMHCTYPDMENGSANGRFYYRFPQRVTRTYDISNFSMSQGHITQGADSAFRQIIPEGALIGIDITHYPSKMRNLSINLLGFFPGGGSFDRVPKDYSFYLPEIKETGLDLLEQFVQYDTTLTGLNLYCSKSGIGPAHTYLEYSNGHSGYLSGEYTGYFSGICSGITYSGGLLSGLISGVGSGCYLSGFSGYMSGLSSQPIFEYKTGERKLKKYDCGGILHEYFYLENSIYSGLFSGNFSGFNFSGDLLDGKIIGNSNLANLLGYSGYLSGYSGEFIDDPFEITDLFSGNFSGILSGITENLSGNLFNFISEGRVSGIYSGSGFGTLVENGSKKFGKCPLHDYYFYDIESGFFPKDILFAGDFDGNFLDLFSGYISGHAKAASGLFSQLNFSGELSGSYSGICSGNFNNGPYLKYFDLPLNGNVYKKDQFGEKITCANFSFTSGIFKRDNIPVNIPLSVQDRIGIDIINTISGIGGFLVAAHGYLN